METQKSNKEEMARHIEACKASGKAVRTYCKEVGLAPSKYCYWQKRLSAADTKSSFTQITPGMIATSSVVVSYPNGVSVSFHDNVGVTTLKELICCI